ncbi:uncharacterized protein Tco025E_10278 [Trypanosoma conorhini]|uniref:Uncharacterized protein n=1 Tax=Trypanosoma conorhini TaxID=83891 RepID=A0A3R7R2E3_9TRYP|nr:uncharacterized protein Tco025E_10278 [Trypanosoma conorhini]RNE94935.1 hypothetical protein Tco025E_10278 [Trypanosoma conorhini]
MSRVDEARLYSWSADLEKRAAAVRSARSKLEDKKAACIQLEASLVELANENDASERLLVQKEHYIASRKAVLEQANTQRSAQRNSLDGERRKVIIDVERVENALDNDWRALEEEEKAAELGHHQRMNRLEQQLEDLEKQEGDLVEKLRQLQNSELGASNLLRQLKQKEDRLRSLSEATLQQMRAELQERETLLNQ